MVKTIKEMALLKHRKENSMADEEHKAAGHIKDSTGSWVDPKDYVDTYYMDWLKNQYDRQREEK